MTRIQSRRSPAAACSLLTRVWCRVLVLLLGLTSIARADHPITVSGTNNLSFGMLFRNSTSSVSHSSSNAGRFTITGKKKRWVLLVVTADVLTVGSGGSTSQSRRLMTPTLTTINCQYSLDGGATWKPFASILGSAAVVLTKFPSGSGSNGTIQVRVGASITSSSVQQRGNYSGAVTLLANYVGDSGGDDDDDDNHGHGNDDDHDDDDNPGHWGDDD